MHRRCDKSIHWPHLLPLWTIKKNPQGQWHQVQKQTTNRGIPQTGNRTEIYTNLLTTVQWQDRRMPQVSQSHNSQTTGELHRMGQSSLESHSSIQLLPIPFFLMFGCEAAVKHTLLESERRTYWKTDDGMINIELMTKLYLVMAHNLNEARKTRDGKKKEKNMKEPVKSK